RRGPTQRLPGDAHPLHLAPGVLLRGPRLPTRSRARDPAGVRTRAIGRSCALRVRGARTLAPAPAVGPSAHGTNAVDAVARLVAGGVGANRSRFATHVRARRRAPARVTGGASPGDPPRARFAPAARGRDRRTLAPLLRMGARGN